MKDFKLNKKVFRKFEECSIWRVGERMGNEREYRETC